MNPELINELIGAFAYCGFLFITSAIALGVVKVWYGIRRRW